jgi:FtsP/CotA-like multicopper oxidase with cupredoxin domain
VVVAGEKLPMKLPAALPKPSLETIRDSEITGRRTLVLGATSPENDVAGHWQEYSFNVDGKVFDASRVDQRVRLGSVEEWTIRNTHAHDDHVFHIHTNPF